MSGFANGWGLFISHDASRTGAPIVLLTFLRWLSAQQLMPFEVLLREGGPLQDEFERIAPTHVLNRGLSATLRTRGIPTGIGRLRLARLSARRPGVVYSNTIANGPVLRELAGTNRPTISHIHELERVISHFGPDNFERVRRHTTQYIACCQAVRTDLVSRGIANGKIDVVHEFVDTSAVDRVVPHEVRRRVFHELGIPSNGFVIGAAGTSEWRKGPELFLLLAAEILRRRPGAQIHFIWVGGARPGEARHKQIMYDVTRLGIDGRVHFIGPRANPLDYFAALDVFALVSREDPYPLVCLEAAALKNPILHFENAGGMGEFVEDDCGFSVPYLDIAAMAERAIMLFECDAERRLIGDAAATKVRARHDIQVVGPRILEIIERSINAKN